MIINFFLKKNNIFLGKKCLTWRFFCNKKKNFITNDNLIICMAVKKKAAPKKAAPKKKAPAKKKK
jgi:hypothetical protein